MRRRLLLLRHGAVRYFSPEGRPYPPDEVRLTEEGRRQAESVALLLREVPLDRIIASGLPRTLETAEIIAQGRGLKVEVWPELREIRPGRLRDLPDPEGAFREAFSGFVPLENRFLGGESFAELLDRVIPAYWRLLGEAWETALLVLHGGVIRALLSYALFRERVFFGGFEVHPCGLSVLDLKGEEALLRAHNLTPYDPLPQERRSTMELLWEEARGGRP